ncbi:MAG: cytochrome b N-terminal domain-containing protein [Pseudomonadota bacterium]
MNSIRRPLQIVFSRIDAGFDRLFGPRLNPLYQLGALGYFFYWIVAATGIYLFIVFDTSVAGAFDSVERITVQQWYFGGVMRSLHRYASDAMVLVAAIHFLREFALDRYRGARWFSWFTGTPILWFLFASGITGFWLVWDKLAQYVAIATSEWLDRLGIFGEPIARNFLSSDTLSDRFFTLLIFMHIALPLILLFLLWIHIQRLTRPQVNPPRALALGTFLAMIALSLASPAVSQGRADLATVPAVVKLDWFYLGAYPLLDRWSPGTVWLLAGLLTLLMLALPWLPRLKRQPAAVVDLDNCNGCRRCAEDCPYAAITMAPRSDGRPFAEEAVVNPALCVACGICAGACPTSTPFRRGSALVPGIDLPGFPLSRLREMVEAATARLAGDQRLMIFGCDHGVATARLASPSRAAISLPCVAMLPPSFIDYVLSRNLAEGVFIAGCAEEGGCYHRLGSNWMALRLDRQRDPRLRLRVPAERLGRLFVGSVEGGRMEAAVAGFQKQLAPWPEADRLMRLDPQRGKALRQVEDA